MTDGEATAEVLHQALNAPSPDAPSLLIAETGSTQTYGELAAAVERAAESCTRLGVRGGDRVAVVMPNGPEFVPSASAVWRHSLGTASQGQDRTATARVNGEQD